MSQTALKSAAQTAEKQQFRHLKEEKGFRRVQRDLWITESVWVLFMSSLDQNLINMRGIWGIWGIWGMWGMWGIKYTFHRSSASFSSYLKSPHHCCCEQALIAY